MVTKYNTGDAILIPATIRSAEERDGQIIYQVDANIWMEFQKMLSYPMKEHKLRRLCSLL